MPQNLECRRNVIVFSSLPQGLMIGNYLSQRNRNSLPQLLLEKTRARDPLQRLHLTPRYENALTPLNETKLTPTEKTLQGIFL